MLQLLIYFFCILLSLCGPVELSSVAIYSENYEKDLTSSIIFSKSIPFDQPNDAIPLWSSKSEISPRDSFNIYTKHLISSTYFPSPELSFSSLIIHGKKQMKTSFIHSFKEISTHSSSLFNAPFNDIINPTKTLSFKKLDSQIYNDKDHHYEHLKMLDINNIIPTNYLINASYMLPFSNLKMTDTPESNSLITSSFYNAIVTDFKKGNEINYTHNSKQSNDKFLTSAINIESGNNSENNISSLVQISTEEFAMLNTISESIPTKSWYSNVISQNTNSFPSNSVEPMMKIILGDSNHYLLNINISNANATVISSEDITSTFEVYLKAIESTSTKNNLEEIILSTINEENQINDHLTSKSYFIMDKDLIITKSIVNTSDEPLNKVLENNLDILNYSFSNYLKTLNHLKYSYHIHQTNKNVFSEIQSTFFSEFVTDSKSLILLSMNSSSEEVFSQNFHSSEFKLQSTKAIVFPISSNLFLQYEHKTIASLQFENIFSYSLHSCVETEKTFMPEDSMLETTSSSTFLNEELDISSTSHGIAKDSVPILLNPVGHITVRLGEAFYYTIPSYTFYDLEDGSTKNMRLYLYHITGMPLLTNFWIKFNASSQCIYGLPLPHSVIQNPQAFLLTAVDSSGQNESDIFHIFVDALPAIRHPSHEFQLILKGNFNKFIISVDNCLAFVNLIGNFFNDSRSTSVVLTSVESGSIVISYTNTSLHFEFCPLASILYLHSLMAFSNGSLTKAFQEYLPSEYVILKVDLKLKGICSPYIVAIPITSVSKTESKSSSSILAIIFSVICVSILLFILIFVSMKFYKRKMLKYKEKNKHDMSTLCKNKAPIMLPEEIHMADIGCQPQRPMLLDVDLLPQSYQQINGHALPLVRTPNSTLAPFRKITGKKMCKEQTTKKHANSLLSKDKSIQISSYNISL